MPRRGSRPGQKVPPGLTCRSRACAPPRLPRLGAALSFVGSSRVAKVVYDRARAAGKKALALGGAKNHLVAAPDAPLEMAAADVVASFAGCAGQRCMGAPYLRRPARTAARARRRARRTC